MKKRLHCCIYSGQYT